MNRPLTRRVGPNMDRRQRLPLVLVVVVAFLAGCTGDGGGGDSAGKPPITVDSPAADTGFRGATFSPARVLPSIALTDTSGRPWNLAQRGRGRLTVVYFGYTQCADVCPTDMADLATARRSLPADIRAKVDVIFITVDQRRDTRPVIRSWLDRFDADLIGLTGMPQQLGAVARSLGVPYRVKVTKAGLEEVEHGSLMTAFSTDGTSRLAWLDGTAPVDITHDLRLLAEGQVPA